MKNKSEIDYCNVDVIVLCNMTIICFSSEDWNIQNETESNTLISFISWYEIK